MSHYNLKQDTKFRVGGYARSTNNGARIYKVLKAEPVVGNWDLTLLRIGDTNWGKFHFNTRSLPFHTRMRNHRGPQYKPMAAFPEPFLKQPRS